MSEQAKGIPNRNKYGNLSRVKPGTVVPYFVQEHDAERAGKHFDMRLGSSDGRELLSWALKKGVPNAGQKYKAIRQPAHSPEYGHWEGKIESGYGKGTVKSKEKGKAYIVDADGDHISFVTAHSRYPERFRLQKTKKGWLLINTTPSEPRTYVKPKFTEVSEKDVEKLFTPDNVIQAKIDGALTFHEIMNNKIEDLSYRTSKVTGRPIVHTERGGGPYKIKGNLPDIAEVLGKSSSESPTVLLGETYGEDSATGKPIPAAETSGLLNASLGESLRKQQEKNRKIKHALFDILKYRGKDVQTFPYSDRYKLLKTIEKRLPESYFVMEGETAPVKQRQLWEAIKSGKHKLTEEGIVAHPLDKGRSAKVKTFPEHDVYITGVFPGGGKYTDTGGGGLEYSLEPGGKPIGRIGTGFSDEDRRDMFNNPDRWKDRVVRIKAQEQLPSGAFRVPVFISRHESPRKESGTNPHYIREAVNKLKQAKRHSDKKEYQTKARIVINLMKRNPDDFFVDSEEKGIVGLTHKPSGFQIHLKNVQIPGNLKRKLKKKAGELFFKKNKYQESLGENIQKYYTNKPGGLPGALKRAQKAWDSTKPKYKMPVRPSRKALWGKTSITNIPFPESFRDLFQGVKGYYDILGKNVTLNETSSKEHELTHASDLRYIPLKQIIRLRNAGYEERKNGHISNHLNNRIEMSPRVAEVKRLFEYTHPGKQINTPEGAKKAVDWFINEGKTYGAQTNTINSIKTYLKNLKDPSIIYKMMPTTVDNQGKSNIGNIAGKLIPSADGNVRG